jgi:tetratricopeptide (TPR) repeat protein
MSPEQAGFGRMDIDTRTDVYSLGVILYELLAGRLPADPGEMGYVEFLSLLSKGALKMLRPSSQILSNSARQVEAAARRATTAAGLKREVKGDLDWIVMKALDVDRERRYDAAIALAEDLGRYLREKPVNARPPTTSYRVGKFVRRHRIQIAAVCVAAFALLAGTVAAGVGLMHATRAETAARQEAATARQVSDLLLRLFRFSNPNQGDGRPATVRELLDRGTVAIETELRGQPKVQANLFRALSHVYEAMGLYRESKSLAEKSLALPHVDGREGELQRAAALLDLGRSYMRLGHRELAEKPFEQALAIRIRILGENHLDVARVLNNLGGVLTQLGRFDEALAAHRRALAIQQRVAPDGNESYPSIRGLGMVQIRNGDYEAALESFRQAQDIVEKRFGQNSPFFADSLYNVALALEDLTRFEEAQQMLERSLEIRKRVLPVDHSDLAFNYHSLGRVLEAQGKLKLALASYQEGVRIRQQALGPDHPRTANLMGSLGMLQARLGDVAGGRRLVEHAFRTNLHAFGPNDENTLQHRKNLVLTLVMAKRDDEAIPHLREMMWDEVPLNLRIDLGDPSLADMRGLPSFNELKAAVARRSAGAKTTRPDAVITSDIRLP